MTLRPLICAMFFIFLSSISQASETCLGTVHLTTAHGPFMNGPSYYRN